MSLMLMMLLVSFCIVTPLLLLCLTWFSAVLCVVDAMIRWCVSPARSVELTSQWNKVLAIGHSYPVARCDLVAVRGLGIGEFHGVVSGLHQRLCDSIHAVLVHRRDDAVRGWRNWVREDPLIHPCKWLRPDLVHPTPSLQCQPHLTPDSSGVLADPHRIDEELRKSWLPYFCRSGQREASLEEFDREVEGWLPLLPEVSLPRLTGRVSWYDGHARILSLVEDTGIWPDGLLDAYITMIPKTDGDATSLGQRPLSVLPIVYRFWASACMGQLDGWFQSWVPQSVFSAGGGRRSVEATD